MTDKQRAVMGLQRKLSEARTKLAAIDPVVEADRSEAQRTEYRALNEGMPALEFRAACTAAEGEQVSAVVETHVDTPEGREYRGLIERANLDSIPPPVTSLNSASLSRAPRAISVQVISRAPASRAMLVSCAPTDYIIRWAAGMVTAYDANAARSASTNVPLPLPPGPNTNRARSSPPRPSSAYPA